MRSIKPITNLLLTFCILSTTYSQVNPVLNYFPSKPKIIFKLNPGSLKQKIKWDEILQYKMFQDAMKETTDKEKDFLTDPSQMGLDLEQGIFVVITQAKINNAPDPVLYCIPKDTAQFARALKKLSNGKRLIKTAKGNLLVTKNAVVAWNNEIVIITGESKEKFSGTTRTKEIPASEITKRLTEKGKAFLNRSTTPFSNDKFVSLLQQQGDMLFWVDNSLSQEKTANTKFPFFFDQNLLKGNYSASVVNFENGEVVMKMKQYVSESLDSLYKKYPLKNISTELIKKLPPG